MLKKYLIIFLVSMVPLIELRGAVPIAVGMNLPLLPSYIVCILGNMLPVPFIFFLREKYWSGVQTSLSSVSSLLLSGKRPQGWTEAAGEGRKRSVRGTASVCGNSASRNRCMDRNSGSQSVRHGL